MMPITEVPSIEERGEDEYFCQVCRCTFDSVAYDDAGGCPGCRHMAEAQAERNQAGLRGAL